MFLNRKNGESQLFPLQHGNDLDVVTPGRDDAFFEEAFAGHKKSADEQNRSFIGSIIPSGRYLGGAIILISAFAILLLRTGTMQIWHGNDYRALADNNRFKHRVLPAERGIIYDRNGKILAKNEPTFRITASKALLPQKSEDLLLMLNELSTIIDFDREPIITLVNNIKIRDEDLLVSEDVTYNEAMLFASKRNDFPGVDLELGTRRSYVTNHIPSLSLVMGYTAAMNEREYTEVKDQNYRKFDHIGKQGLEAEYETSLRGTYGEEVVEVNALGKTERIVSKINPVNGENLYLSLDSELQSYIEKVLTEALEGQTAEKASVIAMDPTTGEVLAMVSWPSYDANLFTYGIDNESYQALINDERLPMFPRAYAGEFPSGSTIKMAHGAAALMEGIITDQTSFLSTGGLRVGPWFFPDWRSAGHGQTNIYWAIADSVNTFFYTIAGGTETFDGLGIEKLMQYDKLFGFGEKTGLDVPGEATGFLPSQDWKLETKDEPWYIGDTYHVAIGQGDFLATPLQIARSTALFANGGILVTPHFNSKEAIEAVRVVPEDVAQIVKKAMRFTVTAGSARSLQTVPIEV
ncbi:penicillin-binding protein 2, partial [Candidatus Uhrbacteria bacterium CG_4_10_14_0_2_um_filter_41_7]